VLDVRQHPFNFLAQVFITSARLEQECPATLWP
jgi:hypothetical protein